ncbi:MAG: hypothetical protein WKF71_17730 [Pyrinomonadaceae bacterium]
MKLHLIRFISSGEVMLDDLVHTDKIEPIRNAIIRLNAGFAVAPVKELSRRRLQLRRKSER